MSRGVALGPPVTADPTGMGRGGGGRPGGGRLGGSARLRGEAAETRDRGAAADADGPTGPGRGYWPEVARLLRESYRSLKAALA